MSNDYTLVKSGDIVFKECMSHEECIKTLAKRIRLEQKDQLQELKLSFLWKIGLDAIKFDFPEMVACSLFVGAICLLFFKPIQAIMIALALILFSCFCVASSEISETKYKIEICEKELNDTKHLSDEELLKYKFKHNPLKLETDNVNSFFELKNTHIVAIGEHDSLFDSYEFKCADENGDVFEKDFYYTKRVENINVEGKLLIELTDDFHIIIRAKDFCD